MGPLLVVYSTRGGHAGRIAERVVDRIRTLGHEAQLQDVRTEALPPLERYSAVVIVASVHLGRHAQVLASFVRARRAELQRVPTLFLSVSVTEAAAVDPHRPDDERLEARRAVGKVLEEFVKETEWSPEHAVPIAGALSHTTHGPVIQLLVRILGFSDAAAYEIVFTDWSALNRVVDGLVREAVARSRSEPPEAPEPSAFRSAVEGAVLAP
jgi:menaquinone-dependent protoporphyrinogen oxidase